MADPIAGHAKIPLIPGTLTSGAKMSHSNRNFAIAYVFLVALPVAGLAGILRSGRILKAPTSVDGAWKVQSGATAGSLAGCAVSLGIDSETSITISQSGKNFGINTGKAVGSGVIDGAGLQATLNPTGNAPAVNCGNDGALALNATVDATANPRVMSGSLSVAGCPTCGSVEFHAVKQGASQKKGAQ
jgi:hypothetical protein